MPSIEQLKDSTRSSLYLESGSPYKGMCTVTRDNNNRDSPRLLIANKANKQKLGDTYERGKCKDGVTVRKCGEPVACQTGGDRSNKS